MQRFKLTLEYDGTAFAGWQRQPDVPSVQQRIEDSLAAFCPQESITLHVAGRTDAGVHALGQVAHVDIAKPGMTAFRLNEALNHFLKDDPIGILQVEAVDDTFHARFSAKKRHYLYRILNRRNPAALDRLRVWHVVRPLDAAIMQQAADKLLGTHDFTSFRSVDCQAKSPVKTLDAATITRVGEEIHCRFSSQSFMYNQIRITVGTLARIGTGDWPPEKIQEILAAKDRQKAGQTAPAFGLYFTQVDYA